MRDVRDGFMPHGHASISCWHCFRSHLRVRVLKNGEKTRFCERVAWCFRCSEEKPLEGTSYTEWPLALQESCQERGDNGTSCLVCQRRYMFCNKAARTARTVPPSDSGSSCS